MDGRGGPERCFEDEKEVSREEKEEEGPRSGPSGRRPSANRALSLFPVQPT